MSTIRPAIAGFALTPPGGLFARTLGMRGRWSNAYFRVLTQLCALCAELKCHSDAETIIGINILFDGGMLFFSEEDPSENNVLWDASDGPIEMTIAKASSADDVITAAVQLRDRRYTRRRGRRAPVVHPWVGEATQ